MESKASIRYVITSKPLTIGLMLVSKENTQFFPKDNQIIKIRALFEDEDEEVQLTYNPRYRRIYGLTEFYRRHNAQVVDTVEIQGTFFMSNTCWGTRV